MICPTISLLILHWVVDLWPVKRLNSVLKSCISEWLKAYLLLSLRQTFLLKVKLKKTLAFGVPGHTFLEKIKANFICNFLSMSSICRRILGEIDMKVKVSSWGILIREGVWVFLMIARIFFVLQEYFLCHKKHESWHKGTFRVDNDLTCVTR